MLNNIKVIANIPPWNYKKQIFNAKRVSDTYYSSNTYKLEPINPTAEYFDHCKRYRRIPSPYLTKRDFTEINSSLLETE